LTLPLFLFSAVIIFYFYAHPKSGNETREYLRSPIIFFDIYVAIITAFYLITPALTL